MSLPRRSVHLMLTRLPFCGLGLVLLLSSLVMAQKAFAETTSDIPVATNPRLEKMLGLNKQMIQLTGKGVKVCVIDSGQNLEIANRKNLVTAPFNSLDGNQDVTDHDGHGTAAAGIIHQLAPQATLIPVKAFNDGMGNHQAVLEGVQHCLDQQADIISISAGVHVELSYRIPEKIGHDFKKALIVVASGNANYEITKEESLTNNVLVVGATNLDRPLQATSYSVFGSGVDLYAPAGADKDGIQTWTPQSALRLFNGTSAATPVVAGVMALLKQKYPHLSATQLKMLALKNSCRFHTGKKPFDMGLMLNAGVLLTSTLKCQ